MSGVILWMAQGFGVGRIPVAPGTFGSVVGLLWFFILLATGNIWLFALGTIAGVALSIWLCDAGEKILRQHDPSSVVFDEICAVPFCFGAWMLILISQTGQFPAPEDFLSRQNWPFTCAIFAGFRFFDVLKPWPVRQSQSLPGGLGVTADDVLAAVYVNLLTLIVSAVFGGTSSTSP